MKSVPALPPECEKCHAATRIRGHYRLLAVVGRGGKGRTYKAFDETTGAIVAIKELSLVEARDCKSLDLFRRGASVLAGLQHPAIPRFIESFEEERGGVVSYFLVREFAEGENLAQTMDRGVHFSEAEASDIARQVLEAIQYLHQLSPAVIHRDIKPSNLMRDAAGKISLIDFDLARDAVTLDRGSTMGMGTPGFTPVEELAGAAQPSADLYSLGVTLAVLLTRKDPHEMLSRDYGRIEFEPHANVSAEFSAILMRLTEPDPAKRYQSAGDALWDLAVLRGDVAPPSTVRRSRAVIAAVVVGILALGGGVAFVAMNDPKPVQAPRPNETSKLALVPDASTVAVNVQTGLDAGLSLEESLRDFVRSWGSAWKGHASDPLTFYDKGFQRLDTGESLERHVERIRSIGIMQFEFDIKQITERKDGSWEVVGDKMVDAEFSFEKGKAKLVVANSAGKWAIVSEELTEDKDWKSFRDAILLSGGVVVPSDKAQRQSALTFEFSHEGDDELGSCIQDPPCEIREVKQLKRDPSKGSRYRLSAVCAPDEPEPGARVEKPEPADDENETGCGCTGRRRKVTCDDFGDGWQACKKVRGEFVLSWIWYPDEKPEEPGHLVHLALEPDWKRLEETVEADAGSQTGVAVVAPSEKPGGAARGSQTLQPLGREITTTNDAGAALEERRVVARPSLRDAVSASARTADGGMK